jgi:hypothetical protein
MIPLDTLHNDIQYNDTQHKGAICSLELKHSTQQHSAIMLTGIILNVVVLNIIALNVANNKGIFATLSINTQHSNTLPLWRVPLR